MLDVRRLAVLRAVARSGSFSEAARDLGYTQPAVSHHIGRLEAETGTPLVMRSGRQIQLTDAGRALVGHADAVLAQLSAAEEDVAAIAGLRSGRVRLAAFPSASATLVPAAARAVKDAHRGVSISLTEEEPPEALGLLRAGDVDLALTFDYPEPREDQTSALDVVPLFIDPLYLVLPATDRRAEVDLADFADATWIAGCSRCRAHLLHLARANGFDPQIDYATDDYVTVQGLVGAGLGVALLPGLALRAAPSDGITAHRLGDQASRRVAAVLPAGPRRPPAVEAMLTALQHAC